METVNTLQHFLDLKAGGIPDEQAKTQAFALNKALYGFATKEDLKMLEKDLHKDMQQLEQRIVDKLGFTKTIGWALFVLFGSLWIPLSKIAFHW